MQLTAKAMCPALRRITLTTEKSQESQSKLYECRVRTATPRAGNPMAGSGPGKPNQRKVSSWTFHRGIPEQKFNVNRACFPKEKHQNSQKWAKFMNFSFWPFLWFGLPGRLLKCVFFVQEHLRRCKKSTNGPAGVQCEFCLRPGFLGWILEGELWEVNFSRVDFSGGHILFGQKKNWGMRLFAYSWKLPAYSGAFLLTVDNFSFFTYSWSFFAYSFSFFTYSWSFFAYSGKVRLIRALRDCKQRSLTKSSNCK